MPFFPHSFKARREAERRQDERDIATAALAGWRFVENRSNTYTDTMVWDTYAPDGSYHGINSVLANAARYALAQMKSQDDSRDGRQGQRMKHDPAADQDRLLKEWMDKGMRY